MGLAAARQTRLRGYYMSARTQVVAAQVLLFLGALASEITSAIEHGTWEIDRLPAILMLATVGYMTRRKGDVSAIEAEQKVNDAWLKGLTLGRNSTPVPAPGGAANDNSAERISNAG